MKLNEYKILDNFVPDLLFKFYYDYVNNPLFPWHYIHNISSDKFIQGSHNFGFSANAFHGHENIQPRAQSEPAIFLFFPLLLMIQEECEGKNILRARFDMTTKTPTLHIHEPHVDAVEGDVPNIACILYLNESDGDTVLFNQKGETGKIPEGIDLTIKKTISPKVNRLLLFDGALIHAGHSPVNYSNRILLNMNFGRK